MEIRKRVVGIIESKTEIVKKVPILGSIPLLGWLFRHKVDDVQKTNLLIFVTPRIVSDIAVAEDLTEEWKEKTELKARPEKGEGGE